MAETNDAASADAGGVGNLVGTDLPALTLTATDGSAVALDGLGAGLTILYVYPLTGRPGVEVPEGWDEIPGARGCTAEACSFRDHHDELRQAGAAAVYGLSSQTTEYQREVVARLHLPFAMLADPTLQLAGLVGLPTFEAGGSSYYQRLTLVVSGGKVEHVLFPVNRPGAHAVEVVGWLGDHRVTGR